MKTKIAGLYLFIFTVMTVTSAWAAESVVEMYAVTTEGTGAKIGTITIRETQYGTLFMPQLCELSEGLHGFHVHAKSSCGPGEKDGQMVPGLAAGGHFDPQQTNSHRGPYDNGHLGDLPALYADSSGAAVHPVLAPRIHLSELKGHTLMIHQGGDNYSDIPKALGGGGARVACGVVQ